MGTKKSLSESFADLINPAPVSFDPEDIIYPDTVAKVVDNEDRFSDEERILNSFRKRNIDLIEEGDERYEGAKTSRKALKIQRCDTDDELESSNESNKVSSETEDLYRSGGDEESDKGEMNGNEMIEPEPNEDERSFQHMSTKSMETEVEKGNAVRTQLNLWDNLLEFRIQLQKTLTAANKLPQYNTFQHFTNQGGSEFKADIQQTKHSVTTLLEKLIAFQTKMLKSYPETKNLNKKVKNECITTEMDDEICSDTGEEEEDSLSDVDKKEPVKQEKLSTRHQNLEHYAQVLSNQHKNYMEYRNATIQKWNDKTRVLVGKLSNRNFSTFEQSTLKQIEQIVSNRQRLIQRSQLKRSSYSILGQELIPQQQQENPEESITSENAGRSDQENAKEYNTEIYDDTDYYHQLLRELIERKSSDVTDPVQLGRQWLELQKLRSKMKRKIDTRATKGRKIRYVVHPKLVNFMAPISQNLLTEEAKTELYNSLFGNGNR